jgi:hypothetical protein
VVKEKQKPEGGKGKGKPYEQKKTLTRRKAWCHPSAEGGGRVRETVRGWYVDTGNYIQTEPTYLGLAAYLEGWVEIREGRPSVF